MKAVRLFTLALVIICLGISAIPAIAQSITSGGIAGTITDPSGAVVPNAKVTVTNDATRQTRTATTSSQGSYRFAFLPPGGYTVSVSATGFQPATSRVEVATGETANGNIPLAISASATTIEVTAPPTQVENGNISTSFSSQQISEVPNPGNDLSAVAQTSPGVIMNTQSGFGNFSSFGLPGTSNLFTIDGQNDNDPFLNLNNSGATNLLLGANEVQEATVTNNGYSGQYGQLAGAQVNYVTKSGSNQFHGNAAYYWNGRVLNANDFINNETSTPRPFDNVNQWAASLGGPIVKDKTFFFWDFEGLRVVLPTSTPALVPDPNFAAATLANIAATQPASLPFYTQIFNLYSHAPGANRAIPTSSCASVGVPIAGNCVDTFRSTAGNFTHEYLTALRIDHKFSDNDTIFARAQTDHGLQATFTDVINPLFNVQSDQPEYQGQFDWTHIVNANNVNEFKASGQWYSAIFTPANLPAALAAFPTTLAFGDGSFSNLGGINFNFPQGRNVTQYQGVDDFSSTHGAHTIKFGANFHRNDITDFDPQIKTSGLLIANTLTDFFNGGATGSVFQQNFPTRATQPIALYGLATYIQDEWRASQKLKLTLALRVDHNSNPVCQTNCFTSLTSPFTSLDHTNSANIPYNQTILTGLHQAYPGTDIVVWQPRFGFAFSPFASNRTVLGGGIGIFADSFPAVVADSLLNNPPTLGSFTIVNGAIAAPGTPGSVFALASAANSTFQSGFAGGGTPTTLGLLGGLQPGFTSTDPRVRQPRFQEWNLELQQELGWNTVISANYVGNHGIYEPIQNFGVNAFGTNPLTGFTFGGLPPAQIITGPSGPAANGPDARFTAVNQIQSIGVSNYNGLVASLRHQFNRGFAFQINYTWSHALDEVSNGGLLPFNDTTNVSPIFPFNPFNVRQNYGNADYDVRHYASLNYVWDDSLRHVFHWGPNSIFGGWTISGTAFYRTGLPFTVIDGATSTALQGQNFGAGFALPTDIAGNPFNPGVSCKSGEATLTSCFNPAGFASATSVLVNQGRNQFRGPGFWDTDFTVMKYIKFRERASLGAGVQFFNLFNHPNFDQPLNNFSAPNFGTILRTVNTPTSILGSFLGGDASPRLIQIKAELKF